MQSNITKTATSVLASIISPEMHAAIQNIIDYPMMWPEIDAAVRRYLCHRFPYGILYSIEEDGIFILAVMHLHRDPDYWTHRLIAGGRTTS